jgi:aspartyl-tRNA(Asn)/glutamyl-tRNA(Gln) amidotransferase subunit A
MYRQTLSELSDALVQKRISSVELTQHFIDRINIHNPVLNSFITVTVDAAMEQARAADAKRARDETTPLTGIPMAHKDIFCTSDIRTSCGSKMLDNFIAPYDATVVEQLNNAGMVILGKTNMDEFAMGSSNETSYYGVVTNPWKDNHVPGGSSGGSAAAVAAGLIPMATGTDTGGSIRQPAALCGITGLKPTYGLVSRYGMIAFASSLDQGGPMTRSAEDAALVLNHMAGFDPRDSTSVEQPAIDYTDNLDNDLDGLKVGLPKQYFNESLDSEVAVVIDNAIRELEKLGATISDIELPNAHLSIPAYYVIAPAECSSNLSRYDGVRFGYRCDKPRDLLDLYCRTRAEGFGREVKRRIMIGTYALSAGYYDAYYLKAQQIRRLLQQDFKNAFTDVDVIVGPTTPDVAFSIGERTEDPVSMYLSDIFTVSVNLAGLPAMSIPAGFKNGLPVGLQLIGNYFQESRLLNIAHRFQTITDWHRRIPEAFQ